MNIDALSLDLVPALRGLWKEAFGDTDAFLDSFFSLAFSPERARCVRSDGGICAALYWFDCEYGGGRVAYLYAIATKKSMRGRGLCTRLIEKTHDDLRSAGYCGAILVPAKKELFAFYEKIGYRTASTVGYFECTADVSDIPFRNIEADEYTKLRREFLPEGGVIQENESIRLLADDVLFYTGRDFLLAARVNDGVLEGAELLGGSDGIPSLVGALGCQSGRFRVPVGTVPFSMYYPFSDAPSPTYFGLALD
jgi:GNAT superfamily N-acetyltransferase